MRKLFLILLIFSSNSISNESKVINIHDLLQRNSIYYEKFSDKSFSGQATQTINYFNPLYRRLNLDDKKKQHDWKLAITGSGRIQNGMKQGVWEYYHESGQLLLLETFSNNKMHGLVKEFFLSGQLYAKSMYIDGELFSLIGYNANGSLRIKEEFTSSIPSVPADGVTEYFYPNGQLEAKTIWNNCCFIKKLYYKNGNIKRELTSSNIEYRLIGAYRTYYENGQLELEQFYDDNGEIQGESRLYYDNGQLHRLLVYKNGKKQTSEHYHPNGQLMFETVDTVGEHSTMYIQYFSDGTIERIDQKRNEKSHGIYIHFREDKSIARYNTYIDGKLDKRRFP